MRKRNFIILALALALSVSPLSVVPRIESHAEEQTQAKIEASDLTFISSETTPKQLQFSFNEAIDETEIGFEYSNSGIFNINGAGEVTPLDIGKGTVKVFWTKDKTVFKEITVSVWEDKLPPDAAVSLSCTSTTDTISITNNSTNVPEGAVWEYSLNTYVWQKQTTFTGLQDDTEYNIYIRLGVKIGEKTYYINRSDIPSATIKTKDDVTTGPNYKIYHMSDLTLKEGINYELNLSSFKDKKITFKSDDESVAKIKDGVITTVSPGETVITIIVDCSTEEKEWYNYYTYNIKVVEKEKVFFTVSLKGKYAYITVDNTNTPEGYIPKFSFDQMTWTDSLVLVRDFVRPEDTIYAAYYDKDGYRRSIITSIDLTSLYGEYIGGLKVTYNEDEIKLEEGKTYDFKLADSKTDDYVIKYTFKADDADVALFNSPSVFTAKKSGTTNITITYKKYYFRDCGAPVDDIYIYTYPVTVTEPASPSPSPTPEGDEGGNKDDGDKTPGGETKKPSDGGVQVPTEEGTTESIFDEDDETNLILTVPTIILKENYFTYNGKVHTPKFTVKIGKKKVKSKFYTVEHAKGRKKVGRYYVKVSMKPESGYRGSMTLYYYIIPKKIKGVSVKASGAKAKVKWKKGSKGSTGYEIQYSSSYKFKKAKTVKVKGLSKTSKKLSIKKGQYVRVRAYYYSKESKKIVYGNWSEPVLY